MKKMMDIRERILKELDQRPGDMFSVSAIAQAVGSNNNATNSALGKLFNAGLVARPRKGVYSSKGRPSEKTAASEPAQAQKPVVANLLTLCLGKLPKPVATKTPKPTPGPANPTSAPTVSLSVVTIDLLVEGEPSRLMRADCWRRSAGARTSLMLG